LSLVVSWLVFPLVLGLLSLGCGLLLGHAAGRPIRRSLLLPVGFSVIVVVALFTTTNDTTAQLTAPLVISLTVAGLGMALPWRVPRAGGWAAAAAAGTYLVFAAPVLFSGSATFAGYITLDDTASWLAFTDRLFEHGRNLTGLAPSSYRAALDYYWTQNGYPVGAFPPLGVGHVLLGTDSAWLFQPYIAFLGALLALAVYGLTAGLVESPRLRALTAFVAAQPALLYGYSLWGGVKEVAASALIVLVAVLAPAALRERTARGLLPLATATAALLGVLNLGGAVWIAPLFVAVLVVGFRLHGRGFVRVAATFAAVCAVLSIPTLWLAGGFFNDTSSILTKETELGNLIHPLSKLQFFGVWPAGDFRLRPGNIDAAYVLIAVVAAAGVAGLVWAWRSRRFALPLYVVGTAIGCAIAVAVGSPWIDGKALAIASPAALVAAMTGAVWLFRGGRRVEAAVVTAAVAGGVLWSNALAYHDVWLAPRSQLSELETIGNRFAGDGPALMTEYQPYGVRHFLRKLDPEGAGELRSRPVLLRTGQELPKGEYADIDRFQLGAVLVYRTLVLVHTPSGSRPPSIYSLVWRGRYYDVWQRPETGGTRILEHLPLGDDVQPVAKPACGDVLRLGRLAAASGGRLAAVVRGPATVVELGTAAFPPGWQAAGGNPDVVTPHGPGTLRASLAVPAAGRYGVWLAGTFRGTVDISIDGRHVGSAQHRLEHLGVDAPFGEISLSRGPHAVELRYGSSDLTPGSGGVPSPIGPLVLSRVTAADVPVTDVRPADARSLCGKSLDWVEALGS
jgi:hypothetical protein